MIGTLIWGDTPADRQEVVTEEELENAIDHLTKIGETDQPFSVTLHMNSETAIQMVVGLEISSLEFYSATGSPRYAASLGPWDEDKWIIFYYHEHYSEKPLKFFVPTDDAREAFRQYFRSGSRPKNIKWVATLK